MKRKKEISGERGAGKWREGKEKSVNPWNARAVDWSKGLRGLVLPHWCKKHPTNIRPSLFLPSAPVRRRENSGKRAKSAHHLPLRTGEEKGVKLGDESSPALPNGPDHTPQINAEYPRRLNVTSYLNNHYMHRRSSQTNSLLPLDALLCSIVSSLSYSELWNWKFLTQTIHFSS